jgi:hypothetical protein
MTTEIRTINHKIGATEVQKVIVTDLIEDSGVFTRAIRIYGLPGGADAPPVIEIVLTADAASKISFTTPELTF